MKEIKDPEELGLTLNLMLMGSGVSVNATIDTSLIGSEPFLNFFRDVPIIDERIPKKCLFIGRDQIADEIIKNMVLEGWDCRQIQNNSNDIIHGLMVDESQALYLNSDGAFTFFEEQDTYLLQIASKLFSSRWNYSQKQKLIDDGFYYENNSGLYLPQEQSSLIEVSKEWDKIISDLSRNPTEVRSLSPRKFEELVAELLTREGYDIELTPITRDGGRDILAYQETILGDFLFLIECKQSANPINVGIVRSLFGVLEAERANAGILVTTSRFTRDAEKFAQSLEFKLKLRDFKDLSTWIFSHTGLKHQDA